MLGKNKKNTLFFDKINKKTTERSAIIKNAKNSSKLYAKSSQNVTGGAVSQTVMLKLRKSFERIKNDIGTRESD
ncbi:hypothetical protein M1N04_01065, partial [Peptococcaceae bacterium]|nr:hypothetical protein [Peptococcaceae bacterium]